MPPALEQTLRDYDTDSLGVSRSASVACRDTARSMLRPPTLARLCPRSRAVRIRFDPPGGYAPMNPSICYHKGALWCVVRAVNYSLEGREYTSHDPHGVFRTENYLGRLDPNGEFIEPRLMRDLDPSPKFLSRHVGYEDVRLVSIKDTLTASASVDDRTPGKSCRVARLHLDGFGDVTRADVQPSNQLHEKNWMPLSVNGEFTWIYSLDPVAILPGPLRSCPLALDHLRGGAAIDFDDGYLCVTHEIIEESVGRIYLHRFVRLDERFCVTAVSPTWVFAHHGIEFCTGIARNEEQVTLSYGIADREAWFTQIDAKEIRNMEWIAP